MGAGTTLGSRLHADPYGSVAKVAKRTIRMTSEVDESGGTKNGNARLQPTSGTLDPGHTAENYTFLVRTDF